MAKIKKSSSIIFDALTLEGGLIAPAMLERIAAREAEEQTETDYGIPKGLTLRDEMARYFRIGQALYREFKQSDAPTTARTIGFVEKILQDVFAFQDIKKIGAKTLDEHTYAVTLEALDGRVPVVIVPPSDGLDRASEHLPSDGRKRSAATAIQDWLNADEESLWGFCSNGDRLRLVRDNASLTRPAYLEADLQQIFENDNFADFTTLWLLIHSSRFGLKGAPVSDCALERWKESGSKEGVAARDRLRDGVEQSLLALGNGFLEHPRNRELRDQIEKGELPLQDFFTQLLRLVYRLIFLLAAEDRNLLHAPNSTVAARKLYITGYSLNHLRKQAVRRAAWDRHHDKWEGLLIVFSALAKGEPLLGLPALGGLFANDATRDLNTAHLSNKALMEAVYRLAWLKEDHRLTPVNWRDMETEELGSVYESLLELTPRLNGDGWRFFFAEGAETKGNARKTTGSYYTPDSLVQALLDSALDPVLDRVERESEDPEKGLLSVSTIDPACGSGHFLLAAARRIASRVARLRAGGVASAEDYRHALRDVVRNCVYGVDRNPMAVELTKVALWIETVEPGKPLGFLDANIRCGDALLGVFDLEALRDGIPDAAYKPLTGDDKETAKHYAQRNKSEKAGQGELGLLGEKSQLPPPPPLAKTTKTLRSLPEDSVKEIAEKKQKFEASLHDPILWKWRVAADMYVAAFLAPKVGGEPASRGAAMIPTTAHVWEQLSNGQSYEPLVEKTQNLAGVARAFHWPLEFPDIMDRGGFDVVLGNPPWDKNTILDREYFSGYPEIGDEKNAANRKKALKKLFSERPDIEESWNEAQRQVGAINEFIRNSGRFPMSGVGELNLYPLFAELGFKLKNDKGFEGMVLKSLIFTGSTWSQFTDHLITSGALHSVYDFKNWESLFSSVGYHERFCLASIGPADPAKKLKLAVGLTNPAQLSDVQSVLSVERDFSRKVNPDTGTLPQCETARDIKILKNIADSYPTLGTPQCGWRARYTRGLDMTLDAAQLKNKEELEDLGFRLEGNWLCEGEERYAPVYEGKLIHQYDHRFATFENIPEDRRFGIKAATNSPSADEYADYNYEIIPRYWVSGAFATGNAAQRQISERWNIGFRDTTNVISNFRTAVACIVGEAAFNYKCPNVVIQEGDAKASALFLAMFNSVPFDFLLRSKFYGANLTKSLLMQAFSIPYEKVKIFEDEIVSAVCSLTNGSNSVHGFVMDAGYPDASFAQGMERHRLRARLDAIMFHLFDIDAEDAEYIFDTFKIWKEKQLESEGSFLAKDLALEELRKLSGDESIVPQIVANALATPVGVLPQNIAMFAIMDVMHILGQNVPEQKARLAALIARKPALALPFMDDTQKAEWQRIVGQESRPLPDNVISLADFQSNQGADHAWGEAMRQLQATNALTVQNNTWSAGAQLGSSGQNWMEGRVRKIADIIDGITDFQAAYDQTIILFLREVHNGSTRRTAIS